MILATANHANIMKKLVDNVRVFTPFLIAAVEDLTIKTI
ncbi:hypothetical protein RV18_GL003184 [Enterococcus termitis]|nr:hypothetical protein RV18_GL003184 [Enterococcus termitis]